jgi:hypothetical protein
MYSESHLERWIMVTVLEAEAVVVAGASSRPLSLRLSRGEIVGLLVADDVDRLPLLRALAGRSAPVHGVVRVTDPSRIVVVSPGRSYGNALSEQPIVLVLDEMHDVVDPITERSAWARLASEREHGTAIVLVTSRIDQAYRSDRVVLAGWTLDGLVQELTTISRRMRPLTAQVLEAVDSRKNVCASKVSTLRRLSRAAADLLSVARAQSLTCETRLRVQETAAELAGVAIDDRILEALCADEGSQPHLLQRKYA